MSESFMTATQVESEIVSTKRLELNGVASTRFAEGLEDEVSTLRDIALVGYVTKALTPIREFMQQIDPDGTFLAEFNLISTSLVDPYFSRNSDWTLNKWTIFNRRLSYGSLGIYDDNKVTVTQSAFTGNGTYLIVCTIETLTAGKLELIKNDAVIQKATESGTYYWEVTFDDIIADTIYLHAKNVPDGGRIDISYLAIYYVSRRFQEYVTKKFKELSPVDMSLYLSREQYEAYAVELTNNLKQFMIDTRAVVTSHLSDPNPHGITPASIGAATATHEHPDLLKITDLGTAMADTLLGYALREHSHSAYVTQTQLTDRVEQVLQARFEDILGADRLTVTAAPTGVLPSRFFPTDIQPPVEILLPSNIAHSAETSFDWIYGDVTTNIEALMHEAPKFFDQHDGVYATISKDIDLDATPVNFRLTLHCPRRLAGYRIITSKNATLYQWDVYSGNTTFLHRISNPTPLTVQGDKRIYERYFSGDIETDCISFILETVSVWSNQDWKVKVEFITNDFESDTIPITKDGFTCVVPSNGVNQLFKVLPSTSNTILKPETILDNIPYYVFVSKDTAGDLAYDTSVIPPEYGNVRKGINALMNRYTDIERDTRYQHEVYPHPILGALELAEGASDDGADLRNIYSSGNEGWISQIDNRKVTITQTFESPHVILSGYMLDWREAEAPYIPESWTLTVEGYNESNEFVTVVYDSVKNFYPFYSAEDDDIIYHRRVDVGIRVKKITLTMQTSKVNSHIALNKFYLYISERFFSIPENTMYRGPEKVTEMCLGYAVHDADKGFVPTNLCLGKCCVIPLNNLSEASPLMQLYEIPNPFFSEHVCCDIQSYASMDSSSTPDAYIASIAADKITVSVVSSFTYAVSISRQW